MKRERVSIERAIAEAHKNSGKCVRKAIFGKPFNLNFPALFSEEACQTLADALRKLADDIEPESSKAVRRLTALAHLEDNWDGEDAPKPAPDALRRAKEIATWAGAHRLAISEIDADVLGGVSVYLRGNSGRKAWIACMNTGEDTVVLSDQEVVDSTSLHPDSRRRILEFLAGDAYH